MLILIMVVQVGNLALLLFLLFFIYAALGIELLDRLECSDAVLCEGFDADHANFKNFGMGILVLFRITTGAHRPVSLLLYLHGIFFGLYKVLCLLSPMSTTSSCMRCSLLSCI